MIIFDVDRRSPLVVHSIKSFLLFCLFLLLTVKPFAQSNITLQGVVSDDATGEPLELASVFVHSISRGTQPDQNGKYSISLQPGNHKITYSLLGYESQTIEVSLNENKTIDVRLKSIATKIDEVVITDTRPEEKLQETETGLVKIRKEEMEHLPYLMGEMDPIRILQFLPGVQTAGEGNTGFYVRGGAVDQNLILLDNSIVYNPSHLFGFFSVFNGSTIDNISLHKGGIPAYHGGRLSSITEINTRKGDTENFHGEGGVGLIAANILVEGPLKKNKGSFLVAARRTYADLFINPMREAFDVEERLNYYFYDLDLNLDYQLSPRDHIRLRAYNGKDDFMFGTGSSFSNNIMWGNSTASLTWLHTFNENLFAELTVNRVGYNMDFGAAINNYSFEIFSDIIDHGGSYKLTWTKDRHTITFGAFFTRHTLRPNNVNAASNDVDLQFNNNVSLYSDEQALSLDDRIKISDKIEINGGVRLSAFQQRGPFTRYNVDDNLQILDTTHFEPNKSISSYVNIEPRFAIRYSIDERSSLKASFDRGFQYMHMAPLSSASLPMDVWVSSSSVIKPQSANQYSAGYFRNFSENTIEASAVAYYKQMRNQIEYRDGVIIGYSKGFNYDDNFVFGDGTSYGLELMAKKNSGKLTGSAAYTLSRTMRKFPDLNGGKPFPAKYDRLHDLSIMANYKANKKWTLGGVFVYGTGNALNLPVARYIIQGNVINEYGARNSFRMPAYHRMDFAATLSAKKTPKFESFWIFSVYNVYNRRNPYYIYFETTGNIKEYKIETSLKQVSLFPVLPSVTYRIKF